MRSELTMRYSLIVAAEVARRIPEVFRFRLVENNGACLYRFFGGLRLVSFQWAAPRKS